ncbi:MAG: hypothetical protein AB8C84_01125 [Oligoflexales bacterium]
MRKLQSFMGYSTTQENRVRVGYARVPCWGQKMDLELQSECLKAHLKSSLASEFEVICALESGVSFKKKGLNKLINWILSEKVEPTMITDKDRLLKCGSEFLFKI